MAAERTGSAKAFLIADIRGFTRFTHDRGDEEAGQLSARFAAVTRSTVERFGGRTVEIRGDEALVVFDSIRLAVRAALELQARFASGDDETDPLPVGMGIDVGEAVEVEGGYRGGALNLAARLCGLANAGEVLVSEATAHLTGRIEEVLFEERGTVRLKNLPEPVRVLRAAPESDDPAEHFASNAEGEPSQIRVVVADDSILFREGVVRLLFDAGFEVAGTAGDAEELMHLIRSDPPDVAITDIRMPPTNTNEGLVAAARIREEFPTVGVLVLSQYIETQHAVRLLEASPSGVGYMLKDRVADVAELADGVRRIAAGGSVIDSTVVSQLLRRRREHDPLERLTVREKEILALMAEGRSNQAISEGLFLSPKTVETHVGHIFDKLRLLHSTDDHRRVLAVITYLRAS